MKAAVTARNIRGPGLAPGVAAAPHAATNSETSAQPLVLVVDDSSTARKIHSVRLERQGCRVMEAASGLSALAQLHRQIPDLILLDAAMPNFDGFATCRKIKADRRIRDVPIVMLSGSARSDDQRRGCQAGADEHLSKPIDSPTLRQVITHFCLTR